MKTRSSFVSNSSSSSFIIYNWSKLPDDKKDKILHYKEHVLDEWERAGVNFVYEKGIGTHPVYNKYGEDSEGKIDVDSDYDFGYLDNCDWRFREKPENGILEMATMMDNFDMERWMDYIGGFDYRWTGDNWGFFQDEEIKFNPNALDFLKQLEKKKQDEEKN